MWNVALLMVGLLIYSGGGVLWQSRAFRRDVATAYNSCRFGCWTSTNQRQLYGELWNFKRDFANG